MHFCVRHGGVKMTSNHQVLKSHLILRCDITAGEKYAQKAPGPTEMQAVLRENKRSKSRPTK